MKLRVLRGGPCCAMGGVEPMEAGKTAGNDPAGILLLAPSCTFPPTPPEVIVLPGDFPEVDGVEGIAT